MNEKRIKIATILIVVGMLGVGIIQMLWLKAAIENSRTTFERKVYESLEEISSGIEELEYKPYIEFLMEEYGYTSNQDTSELFPSNPDGSPLSKMEAEEFNYRFQKQMLEIQQLMMKEMLSLRPINEALDTSQLNSLIKQVLQKKGIKTTCHFGITEYADNNFVFVSPGADLLELFQTGYSIKLFPNSIIDANKFLKLTFPDQKQFLLSSFAWPILSSIAFFFMIIAAFAMSYQIIFRQKKLSEMKTDFINNMTHELKTPIATISLASEMLKDKNISAIENSRLKYAGIIFEENKRLANHVEQVLQIARLEKGELQLNISLIDLHELIKGVVRQFDLICEEYEGTIELHLHDQQIMVEADEMHLSNTVKNLLDNAFKYNDKKPHVIISTRPVSDGVQIQVSDNGIGLSKENQKRIFEKFYRVQTGNIHDTKGFGLGLNYVKSIVEAHNGSISVESKLKEGTTFVMYFPYKS